MYSGYKKKHCELMQTMMFPNRISTTFGPVSGRMNDRGVLNLSGLDTFLFFIQAHLPPHDRCMVFGGSIYRGHLQMITSYYHAIPPNDLTFLERVFVMQHSEQLGCLSRRIMECKVASRESVSQSGDPTLAAHFLTLLNSGGCAICF